MQLCSGTNWLNFPTNGTMGSCTAGNLGKLEFDTTNKVFRYCNGSNWQRSEAAPCTVSSISHVAKIAADSTALNQVSAAVLSPDGQYLYTGGDRIRKWSFSAATPAVPVKVGHSATAAAMGIAQELRIHGNHVFAIASGNRGGRKRSCAVRRWNKGLRGHAAGGERGAKSPRHFRYLQSRFDSGGVGFAQHHELYRKPGPERGNLRHHVVREFSAGRFGLRRDRGDQRFESGCADGDFARGECEYVQRERVRHLARRSIRLHGEQFLEPQKDERGEYRESRRDVAGRRLLQYGDPGILRRKVGGELLHQHERLRHLPSHGDERDESGEPLARRFRR